jgi:nickel superoxide dismutase
MKDVIRPALRLVDRISPPETVSAHCDIPCGIYDPHLAQIAALTVVRMNQLINDLQAPGMDASGDDRKAFLNSYSRYVAVKEHHAELAKHEVRIIWGDYIKPEHIEKHPQLHDLVFQIMKLGSQCRQQVDMKAAEDLLANIQKFAEIFWETKGASTTKGPSRQAAGGELVYPA